MNTPPVPPPLAARPPWVTLFSALGFILRQPKLLLLSTLLIFCTAALTWLGYILALDWVNSLTGSFFTTPPEIHQFWDWAWLWGWTALKWIFVVVSHIIAFYLAFMVAYSLTTPGYSVLSTLAGNRYTGKAKEGEGILSVGGILIDLFEGIKIGLLGILVTLVALVVNFVPVIGQACVFLLYVYYSTLMFIDYPASRYRWSLGEKIGWVRRYSAESFRLGLLPALVGMIPLINVFFMALLFPLFTVYTTLNFMAIEKAPEPPGRA